MCLTMSCITPCSMFSCSCHIDDMLCHVVMACHAPICIIHRFCLSTSRSCFDPSMASMYITSTIYPSIPCHPFATSRHIHPNLTCDFVPHVEPSFSSSQPIIIRHMPHHDAIVACMQCTIHELHAEGSIMSNGCEMTEIHQDLVLLAFRPICALAEYHCMPGMRCGDTCSCLMMY